MKTCFKSMLFVALSVVLLTSCSDDDDENEITGNYVSIEDNEFNLKGGALEFQDVVVGESGEDLSWLSLMLYSDGLEVYESDGEIEVDGEGFGMFFEALSSAEVEGLGPGKYTYIGDMAIEAGLLFYGDYEDVGGNLEGAFVSGAMTVEKDGDDYEITFDMVNEEGHKLKGYYKGSLYYYGPE
ncbi:hypothetical protein LVD15_03390 [Fulvivirga maritima]|uniref:DUF4999 domain-containing protein n=1 Tax=Fulvivirga maritima TaxID=2904247 RepID=UPI001F373613|nr:hypothetical protein [Fulvivirga maritima]UII27489.1 hypothetical protein LVD15_03390 [Fulvivirga maritima]